MALNLAAVLQYIGKTSIKVIGTCTDELCADYGLVLAILSNICILPGFVIIATSIKKVNVLPYSIIQTMPITNERMQRNNSLQVIVRQAEPDLEEKSQKSIENILTSRVVTDYHNRQNSGNVSSEIDKLVENNSIEHKDN